MLHFILLYLLVSLDICLTLDGTLPQASQSVAEMIASELQTILVRLLGKSLVSTIRHFNLNKVTLCSKYK